MLEAADSRRQCAAVEMACLTSLAFVVLGCFGHPISPNIEMPLSTIYQLCFPTWGRLLLLSTRSRVLIISFSVSVAVVMGLPTTLANSSGPQRILICHTIIRLTTLRVNFIPTHIATTLAFGIAYIADCAFVWHTTCDFLAGWLLSMSAASHIYHTIRLRITAIAKIIPLGFPVIMYLRYRIVITTIFRWHWTGGLVSGFLDPVSHRWRKLAHYVRQCSPSRGIILDLSGASIAAMRWTLSTISLFALLFAGCILQKIAFCFLMSLEWRWTNASNGFDGGWSVVEIQMICADVGWGSEFRSIRGFTTPT